MFHYFVYNLFQTAKIVEDLERGGNLSLILKQVKQ